MTTPAGQSPDGALVAAHSKARAGASSSDTIAGFVFVFITSVGWGFNWPVVKYLLSEWPPLSARGVTGLIGAALLALVVRARGRTLHVPRRLWPLLIVASMLNVGIWLAAIGFSLLWLRAGEVALIAATIPVWVSLLAWPVLKERFSLLRALALALALGGLGFLFAADGIDASMAKWPGILLAFTGCFSVSLGTIVTKKKPLPLAPMAVATWQIGLGCVPVALGGLLLEHASFAALSTIGWAALAYVIVVQFCVCYASWFAALERLPASTTSIGMLLIPVIGVVSSAALLREPLGPPQIAALVLTLGAVILALRA